MPTKLALDIELGVGEIQIEDFSNELTVELGVGSVQVDVNDTDYRSIHLSAGVGDSSIRGFPNNSDNERSFISADSYYHGSGDLEIEIEVGVGDVRVRAN